MKSLITLANSPGRRVNGLYDPGILKAVFLAGGPGSGKSYTAAQLFGVPKGLSLASSAATGLKLVNGDPYFEHYLKKAGVDPAALATLSAEQFAMLTEGAHSPRGRAKRVRDQFLATWLRGRLGLILDGTGDDFAKIQKQYQELVSLGYDPFMVFVNTSLEVAQARNAARPRKLPAHLVETIWRSVQENIGAFQQLFGARNIAIIDASQGGPIPREVVGAVDAFLRRPVQNMTGRRWLAEEAARRGIRTNDGRRRPRAR